MVTYTSSSTYWAPLKPRIRIYAFSDTTYATPLYSYDPFTDAGGVNKPISLQFESLTTNAGTFSLEIEDPCSLLDPDLFMKGNRVFIDCSKDGSTYQPAFKGLVRSSDQQVYGPTGKNLILNGYSYLIRLNERIINVIKESTKTGNNYNRTDSNMFTNTLMADILNTDANYVYSIDDASLSHIFKTANIPGSPVVEWIPRLDAQLVTISDAIDKILEYSNGLLMIDFSTDELVLYNSQQVTSATSVFLLTNQMNQNADDADITMYPVDPYKYNISYDYPDSASRLIVSYKSPDTAPADAGSGNCPDVPEQTPDPLFAQWTFTDYVYQTGDFAFATQFVPSGSPITRLRLAINCQGNVSSHTSSTVQIRNDSSNQVGTQVGSNIPVYAAVSGVPTSGTAYPSATTTVFILGMEPGQTGPSVTPGSVYWICFIDDSFSSNTVRIGWIQETDHSGNWAYSTNGGSTWSTGGGTVGNPTNKFDYASPGIAACGGVPATPAVTKDVFDVAHDRNMSNKIGVVERAITSLPTHLTTLQTIDEYLYNKLYVAAKPRFTFDFPSVSMPNKMPKAGDIVCHVDKRANVGIRTAPIQTGVITQVSYDFAQGSDESLGLRKLGLSTSGIRRGYY